jgi:hypothetical protein
MSHMRRAGPRLIGASSMRVLPATCITTNLFLQCEQVRDPEHVHLKRVQIASNTHLYCRYELFLELRHRCGYRVRWVACHLVPERKTRTIVIFSGISFLDADYIFSLMDYTVFYLRDRWLPSVMHDRVKEWGEMLYPTGRRHHHHTENELRGTTSTMILAFHRVLQSAIPDNQYWRDMKFTQSPYIHAALLALEETIRREGRVATIYRDRTREANIVNGMQIDIEMLMHIDEDKNMPRLPQRIRPERVTGSDDERETDEKKQIAALSSIPSTPEIATADIKIEIDLRDEDGSTQEEAPADARGRLRPDPCPRCLEAGCHCWEWSDRMYADMVDHLTDDTSLTTQTQLLHSISSFRPDSPHHT